eukprot:TRINITY_DN637_c1_g1_i1.p1 TRINITY_DN637_c1_g1~~TRINITY_DN637_c1_g1_i1.p1  ORF type:complete len:88 (-),score=11.61 TRINITY_DN637_c1_g1_i1:370-633(-)
MSLQNRVDEEWILAIFIFSFFHLLPVLHRFAKQLFSNHLPGMNPWGTALSNRKSLWKTDFSLQNYTLLKTRGFSKKREPKLTQLIYF